MVPIFKVSRLIGEQTAAQESSTGPIDSTVRNAIAKVTAKIAKEAR